MAAAVDPRVLFAAERTLLAWQRTGLALMGFGFVVARFGPQSRFSLGLGVFLTLLAAVVALVSARQYRQLIKSLEPNTVPRGYWTNAAVVLNGIIASIAVILGAHILWTAG